MWNILLVFVYYLKLNVSLKMIFSSVLYNALASQQDIAIYIMTAIITTAILVNITFYLYTFALKYFQILTEIYLNYECKY